MINLVTEFGIEARVAGLVGNKHALFSGLFDSTTDAVRYDGPSSFVGDIEGLVEPVEAPELEVSDRVAESTLDAELDTSAGEAALEPSPRVAEETSASHAPSAQPTASQGASSASPNRPALDDAPGVAQLVSVRSAPFLTEGAARGRRRGRWAAQDGGESRTRRKTLAASLC